MTPGRAALVELMNRYVRGLLDPTISLLVVHKLMYFMQEGGEPPRLRNGLAPSGALASGASHGGAGTYGALLSTAWAATVRHRPL